MKTFLSTVFSIELALLFAHEMDAIRNREWRMFLILKDMPDEKAYHIFTLLHIPIYVVIILLLSSTMRIGFIAVDVFLIAHMVLHLGFRKHPNNNFNHPISSCIIFGAGWLALLHLILIYISSASIS